MQSAAKPGIYSGGAVLFFPGLEAAVVAAFGFDQFALLNVYGAGRRRGGFPLLAMAFGFLKFCMLFSNDITCAYERGAFCAVRLMYSASFSTKENIIIPQQTYYFACSVNSVPTPLPACKGGTGVNYTPAVCGRRSRSDIPGLPPTAIPGSCGARLAPVRWRPAGWRCGARISASAAALIAAAVSSGTRGAGPVAGPVGMPVGL